MSIEKEITEDFVNAMKDDTTSIASMLVADGHLPIGVIETDPRVIEIIEACRKARNIES